MARAKRWDVVVFGGANWDCLVRATRLPRPGETVEGNLFVQGPGGKGANQAVAAARLGARVAFAGRVGSDPPGERLVDSLRAEGIETSRVRRDAEAATGVALICVDNTGEKQIVTAPGANRSVLISDAEAIADELTATRVLLVQLELPMQAVARAVEIAARAGARVVLDPSPATPVRDEMLGRVDVVRLNAAEASALTGIGVRDRETALHAAEALVRRGALHAIVAAPGGNLVFGGDTEAWIPHVPVETVDLTGAGDAFSAAIAVALSEDHPIEQAAQFASAASALATTAVGAQSGLPRREQVEALLAARARQDPSARG